MQDFFKSHFSRGQKYTTVFFLLAFIVAFASAVLPILVPELKGAESLSSAQVDVSPTAVAGMVLSLASLFVTFQL